MQQTRTGLRCPRVVAVIALVTTVVGLLVAPGLARADPPPNPSDNQISSAQQHKNDLASAVGRLSAQTAQLQTQLERLKAEQELAEQRLALALSRLADAKAAAETAKAIVAKARTRVEQAQQAFVGFIQASYMSGEVTGMTSSLLTADDPNTLLEAGALDDYQSSHELSAIGDLQRARVAKSNADAAARQAVAAQIAATDAAESAKQQAVAAVGAARSQERQLQATLTSNRAMLQRAQLQLATLNNERATYLAYQREQARIAAAKAAEEAQARATAVAAAAARAAANNNDGSGGGGGGGTFVPPGPTGDWTPAAGQQAVDRAESWLGEPYAWAAGSASGPTLGVCAGNGASNDCHVIGFDCSGLAMFAWAQFPFAHNAAIQYSQGSAHPDTSSLMPGDLVFWSADGTVAGIHHVAVYVGGGDVIQAPESGDIVRITPLGDVDSGYFGATRPLT